MKKLLPRLRNQYKIAHNTHTAGQPAVGGTRHGIHSVFVIPYKVTKQPFGPIVHLIFLLKRADTIRREVRIFHEEQQNQGCSK